jgi:enoyl-[acyl-carrier protein] reductase II
MTQRFLETQRTLIERVNQGEVSQKDAQLEIEHFWAGALRRAVIDGDVETGSVMAGQSVGMVTREQSTQEVIDEFIAQALAVLVRRMTDGEDAAAVKEADGVTDPVG